MAVENPEGLTPAERDDLGRRVFADTVYLGKPVKLTSWCDAAAVIETLEAQGYEIREAR